MAPSKGLSSSFSRSVPEDRNVMPWGRPQDVFAKMLAQYNKRFEITPEHAAELRSLMRGVEPGLVTYDMQGVQPMTKSNSEIFTLKVAEMCLR